MFILSIMDTSLWSIKPLPLFENKEVMKFYLQTDSFNNEGLSSPLCSIKPLPLSENEAVKRLYPQFLSFSNECLSSPLWIFHHAVYSLITEDVFFGYIFTL